MIITFIAVILAANMAAGQIIVKEKNYRNWITFYLLICVTCILLHSYIYYTGAMYSHIEFYFSVIPCMFLMTPLIFIYYKILFYSQERFQKKLLIHFIPSAGSLALMIPFYFSERTSKLDRLERALSGKIIIDIPNLLLYGSLVIMLIYFSYIIAHVLSIWQLRFLRKIRYITFYIIIFSVVLISCLTTVASLYFGWDLIKNMFKILTIIISLVVIFANLANARYPNLLQRIQLIIENGKYARSLIGHIDLPKIHRDLVSLMMDEKLYRLEDVSLGMLSEKLGVTTHQLSQFLNEKIKKNFHSYINEYRILEAKEELRHNPQKNILNIALEVGFNSKSAFNTAFKKITNLTPSDYKKLFEK